MEYFEHRSTSPVVTHTIKPKSGKGRSLTYRVVFLESVLERSLRFGRGSRLRFIGEFEGVPMQGAWQSSPGKGHYVMLSKQVLAQAAREVGDEATIAFNIVGDDVVVVPEDVAAALARARRAERNWKSLSPARRRAQLAQIETARTAATRERRIARLVATMADA
jgi:hypothetical protein